MSLTALNLLIRQATFCETFGARCARRNEILSGIYRNIPGPHWTKLATLADAISAFRAMWRQNQYAAALPPGCDWMEQQLFEAAKVLGKLPPATSRGLHAALKNTKTHFSTAHFNDS